MKTVSFIDLFAGAGGLSLGLVNAGWTPIVAVDVWQDAARTYRRNFPGHPYLVADVKHIDGDHLVDVGGARPTWIVGGPPCQGFSTVGKRIREDPRNFLVRQFIRLVGEVKPEGVLIENVLGLRDMQFVSVIQTLLQEIGYRVTPIILTAADYGVPQLRRRVFFVCDRRGRAFIPPAPTHLPHRYVTVQDAIGDLPELRAGETTTSYGVDPETNYQRDRRADSDYLQGHQVSKHPHHLVKAISFIPDGGNRRHIPPEYQPASGFHNSYSRLHSASPAVAVTQNMGKPSGTRCIHPFQNRGLTAREGARLQGFPDAFHFLGGVTSQRLQIANAVSPILAEVLGRSLASEESWVEALEDLRDDRLHLQEQLIMPVPLG